MRGVARYTVQASHYGQDGDCGHIHGSLMTAMLCLQKRAGDGVIRRVKTEQLNAVERKRLAEMNSPRGLEITEDDVPF